MSSKPEEVTVAEPTVTLETLVRTQLSKALGGKRGMLEGAIPTIGFTVTWITTHNLNLSLVISVGLAVVLLLLRIVQRSTPQFVLNSLVGIGIAAVFALRSGRAEDAFLPGIIYNAFYAVALGASALVRWPLVGFMIGSVTGDPTAWHADRQVVRLCTRLTWLLVLPCAVRAVVQGPVWLAGHSGSLSVDTAVAALGVLKIAMGWPLQLAALGAMSWLLGRNHTPLQAVERVRPASGQG